MSCRLLCPHRPPLRALATAWLLGALFLVLAPHAEAQSQSSPNLGTVSSTATGNGTIVARYNVPVAQVQSNSVYFTFHVPYQLANVSVNVVNTPSSPVPLDYVALFNQYVQGLSISQSPLRNHTVSAQVRTGWYRIIIGPQWRQPGVISFNVTVTVQNAQPVQAPPVSPPVLPPTARANMCNPTADLGSIGNGARVRTGINIGPGEYECYKFRVGPSQLGARYITVNLNLLPATGTKTFSLYNQTTGTYLVQGFNFAAQSYQNRFFMPDGEYFMIIVAGADGRDRSNYGWSLQ
jgi:hypothetical protein